MANVEFEWKRWLLDDKNCLQVLNNSLADGRTDLPSDFPYRFRNICQRHPNSSSPSQYLWLASHPEAVVRECPPT